MLHVGRFRGWFCNRPQGRIAIIVIFLVVVAVITAANTIDPSAIALVPINRVPEPLFQGYGRFPTQLFLYLLAVKSIAAIVPRPVFYVGEERFRFVENAEKAASQGEIFFDIKTADVVNLTGMAAFEDGHDAAAVVCDV